MVRHDDDGPAVCAGCSHPGILNMIDASVKAFPRRPLDAVTGSFRPTALHVLPFISTTAARTWPPSLASD